MGLVVDKIFIAPAPELVKLVCGKVRAPEFVPVETGTATALSPLLVKLVWSNITVTPVLVPVEAGIDPAPEFVDLLSGAVLVFPVLVDELAGISRPVFVPLLTGTYACAEILKKGAKTSKEHTKITANIRLIDSFIVYVLKVNKLKVILIGKD